MALTAARITKALGAELHGFDPRTPSDELADDIHQHLMAHQVVMVRGAGLAPSELAGLGRALGPLGERHHSYVTHPDADDVVILEWGGEAKPDAAEWHADMTYREHPPFGTLLQAVVVPPLGGDTLFASMGAALDALPSGLAADLAELEAVHDPGAFRTPAYRKGGNAGVAEAMAAAGTAVHPVIGEHPVTGRPYLNVSESFTRFIIGLSAPESARLLTQLFDHINRPEFHVRFRWEPDTLVIWDNRGAQHYACNDYLPDRRVMHRVVIAEDARTPGVVQADAA